MFEHELSETRYTNYIDHVAELHGAIKPKIIGENGIRNEGIIFSVGPEVVKLFKGSKLDDNYTEFILEILYPDGIQREGDSSKKKKSSSLREHVAGNLANDNRQTALYFSSAEIFCRTVAHRVLPESMPSPLGLVDEDGFTVGFVLGHDREVTAARDVDYSDKAYNLTIGGRLGKWYWLPEEARSIADVLEEVNVPPWIDIPNLREQLLYDSQGDFMNFARTAYVFPD